MKQYCYDKADIPVDEHYAVMMPKSVYIPGDERSRTNPGHGYPSRTENCWDYFVFDSKEEWEEWIKAQASDYGGVVNFVAFHHKPARVTKDIVISVD